MFTIAVGGGLAACGGGDDDPPPLPTIEAFAPGTCQELAPDLLETMRLAQADHSTPDGIDVLAHDLIPAQERLYDRIGSAGEFASDVEGVTTAVGFLRLRVAAGSYEPNLLTEVTTTARTLVDRCT